MKMAVCGSLICAPAKASTTLHPIMIQSRAWIVTGITHWFWQGAPSERQRSLTPEMERSVLK